MNNNELYSQMIADFGLENLSEEEREDTLLEIAKTIQKQFLLDVYEVLGDEKFNALHASANMGEEFYQTTLKHLIPNHEEMLIAAKEKVKAAFQQGE